jgi:hypothetical protein
MCERGAEERLSRARGAKAAGSAMMHPNAPVMIIAAIWLLLLPPPRGEEEPVFDVGESPSAGWVGGSCRGLRRGDSCSISAGISTEDPQTGEVQHSGSCKGWLSGGRQGSELRCGRWIRSRYNYFERVLQSGLGGGGMIRTCIENAKEE